MAKILLADDSGHAQRMGAKILAAEGHEVSTVSNGHAAVKMLKDFIPDLIVADVFMPGKTGYELCEFVKKDPQLSYIPVVLIVAPIEPYDASEGKRVKADGLVTKPLEKSDLVAEVQRLLASVKKPPPPPPKPAAPEPAAFEASKSGTEIPAFESIPTPVELEIPEEMRQQPVSLFGDLLESPVAPSEQMVSKAEPIPPEISPLETIPLEQPEQFQSETLVPVTAMEQTEIEQLHPAPESPLEGDLLEVETSEEFTTTHPVVELSAAAPSSWTAEAVAVTEEDKKLFEPPPPDWQGLVSMVQEQEEEGYPPFSPAIPAVGEPAPLPEVIETIEPPAAPAPPPMAELPSLEHPTLAQEATAPLEVAEAMDSAPPAEPTVASASETATLSAPSIAPLDYATVEQIVRETVEEMMPQIVDRIAQATGIAFRRKP